MCVIDLAAPISEGFLNPSVSATVEKKCLRCGEPFSCQQEAGCWCATMRLDPATLAELRTRFSDCLCEDCLRRLAPNQK